jgi:hypothetical protein
MKTTKKTNEAQPETVHVVPKEAEGLKPREKGHLYLEIRRLDGTEIYKRMDVTDQSEHNIEKTMMGAMRNMDLENWCIEDVKA